MPGVDIDRTAKYEGVGVAGIKKMDDAFQEAPGPEDKTGEIGMQESLDKVN